MLQVKVFRIFNFRYQSVVLLLVIICVISYQQFSSLKSSSRSGLLVSKEKIEDILEGIQFPDDEKEESADTKQRLLQRRKDVHEWCAKNDESNCKYFKNSIEHRIYYFHQYNTSVCTIAKAGSSTWRAHLRRVNNGPPFNVPIFEDEIRNKFINRSLETIIKDVKTLSKIMTVRHPLTRLVSAYRNKYNDGGRMSPHRPKREKKKHKKLAGSYWEDRFYQFWLPVLMVNNMVPPDIHLEIGLEQPIDERVKYKPWVYERMYDILQPRVSFTHFLKFVVKSTLEGNPDAHWSSYARECCPCSFDYEYITKVETLTDDLEYVFKELNLPADPDTSMNQNRKDVSYIYKDFEYYRDVPLKLQRDIYLIFKKDFELYGYGLPKFYLRK